MKELEVQVITAALRFYGSRDLVASTLGISRRTLDQRIKDYDIKPVFKEGLEALTVERELEEETKNEKTTKTSKQRQQ